MRSITIAGRLGRDAEPQQAGNSTVTSFSVAVDVREGQSKSTMWFDVGLWGKRGDALAPYLKKGTNVAVSGQLSTREHNGKTYLKVQADEVTLLGGQRSEPQRNTSQGGYDQGPLSDEIPFMREDRV